MDLGKITNTGIQNIDKSASAKKAKKTESEHITQKDEVIISSQPEKELTFLTYLDGSNNLGPYIMQNLIDMEKVGSTDNMNIVAQLSRFEIPTLTTHFFGEALKQVVQDDKFAALLKKEIKDPQAVSDFQEMFQDSDTAAFMAETILGSNPPLMQGITSMVKDLTGQVVADKDVGQMIKDVALEVAKEALSDGEEGEEKVVKGALMGAGTGNSKRNQINQLSGHMMNGIKKFMNEKMGEGKFLYVDGKKVSKTEKSEGEPEWIGARRYYVTKGKDDTKISSKVVEDMGFVNMGEPKTLTDFLVWGIKNFPAKKYVVLASDHGAGILGGFEDRGQLMTLPQINKALANAEKQTGVKPEVLVFDCCLMAQAEVGYELKDRAKVMVASEETVGGMGMPYVPMLKGMNKLAEKGEITPENVANLMIKECGKAAEDSTTTFSAIDLTKMGDVKSSLDKLAKILMAGEIPEDTIKFILHNTTAYSQDSPSTPYRDFRDLGHLADNLINSKEITDPKVKAAAEDVKKALASAVIAEEHVDSEDYAPSQGMTIYAPKSDRFMDEELFEQYKELSMSKKGIWDDFIEQFTGIGFDDGEDEEEKKKTTKPKIVQLPQRH